MDKVTRFLESCRKKGLCIESGGIYNFAPFDRGDYSDGMVELSVSPNELKITIVASFPVWELTGDNEYLNDVLVHEQQKVLPSISALAIELYMRICLYDEHKFIPRDCLALLIG